MLQELSAAQQRALADYESLLRDRAVPLGLISLSDRDRLGERHVSDSLRAAGLLTEGDSLACDIGSGSGLPGIVLAVARPRCSFVLVEPRQRAVGFLELVIDRLGLENVEIEAVRVEDAYIQADVATARAYGSLEKSWQAACRVVHPGGRLIYFAGEGLEDPAAAARSLDVPERAGSVQVEPVVAGSSPLVIMTRQG